MIPNGILTTERQKPTTVNVSGSEYFLYIGRLETRKNVLFLIEAFARYTQQKGGAELLLVGPAERGYDNILQARVDALGLNEKIKILPPAFGAAKQQVVRNAIAVIYPCVDEPFGRVPFEAVAEGTPVVVPDESGSAEYLSRFLKKCVYHVDDKDSLAEVLILLSRVGKKSLSEAVRHASDWVRTELKPSAIAGKTYSVYEQMTDPGLVGRISR